MKIAVTGATGFVGRYVVASLDREGVSAVRVVRPSSVVPADWPTELVARIDVSSAPADAVQRMGEPDLLIHLAWSGLPNYRSLHHFEAELPRHYAFLRNMVDAGLRSLVTVGTCFEYGMQSGPLHEELQAAPANPYGFAKDALRRQLEFLRMRVPFELTWARLFYLYGEGQAESSLYTQLRSAAAARSTRFDMSGGEQLRDFLPIETAARYLARLALCRGNFGVVNVCSGVPVSVRARVESWLRDLDWRMELNLGHYPYPDYEPMAFWGDARKLHAILASHSGAPLRTE